MAWSQEITQSTYGDRTSEERIYIPRDSTREKVRVVFREFQLARRRLRSRSGGRAGPQTVRKAVGTVSQRTSRRSHSKSFLRVTSGPREARVSGPDLQSRRSTKETLHRHQLETPGCRQRRGECRHEPGQSCGGNDNRSKLVGQTHTRTPMRTLHIYEALCVRTETSRLFVCLFSSLPP